MPVRPRRVAIRVIRPGDPEPRDPVRDLTPQERLAMMWPLALDAWEFMGEPVIEPRLPRHIVRVLRGAR